MTLRDPIIDPFGRRIDYVRLSVTDRCNFRCVYCMPAEGIDFIPRDDLLRFEEIEQLARVLAQMGVEHIRLTGGEPTVRRGVIDLVGRVSAATEHGLRVVSMTTNGWNLSKLAAPLREAGLTRVNISLDTLDRAKFAEITRVDRLDDVLAGIETAAEMGWLPLKLNVVVCRGLNEDEVADFIARFADLPVTLRFIEYMPFGESKFSLVPWEETRGRIEAAGYRMHDARGPGGSGPAQYWAVEGTRMEVGAIGALSRQFCENCNRVRVTSDGRLKTCLAYEPEMVSLRDVMRNGGSDDELEATIRLGITNKPEAHITTTDGGNPFEGSMVQIGG